MNDEEADFTARLHQTLRRGEPATMFSAARLLTQDCVLCGAASEDIVCAGCRADLTPLPEHHCPVCAQPSPNSLPCGHCLAHPHHFDRSHAVYAYGFPLDRLIQSFKYGHRLALGPYFGQQMAELVTHEDIDLIIPLPLHPERLRERGYNQSLVLARPIARRLGRRLDKEICQRIRHTASQAELPWKERAKNMRGAFHCSGDLSGLRILLVDDVMTTGATLDECARTLKLHGAASVTLAVVARALRE